MAHFIKLHQRIFALLFVCTHVLCCFGQFSQIETGDLLFVGLPLDFSLVADTTPSHVAATTNASKEINYIHVAILEVDSVGERWIIDATIKRGVARYPLDTFLLDFTLPDGNYPLFVVKRLRSHKNATEYVANAKTFCGRGYDIYFQPDNQEQYCSELVRNAYIRNGKHLFSEYPIDFKSADGTFPPYWVQLFDLIQQSIPQGIRGTTPNSMIQEKCLKSVY